MNRQILIREIEVVRKMRSHLTTNDFNVEPRPGQHGPDIVARKGNRTFYFEVQGNRKPKERNALTSSQKYTHFLRMLGQIIMRLNQPEYCGGRFAIGIPQDDWYCKKLDLV